MIKRRIMKKKGTSALMVVLTTLTVALSGCSSDKAGDSENASNQVVAGTDSVTSTESAQTGSDSAQASTTSDDLSKLIVFLRISMVLTLTILQGLEPEKYSITSLRALLRQTKTVILTLL